MSHDPAPLSAVTASGQPRCQSVTGAGRQCAKPAVEGRTRCKTHGGNGQGREPLLESKMKPADQERLRKARERVSALRAVPLDPTASVIESKALLALSIDGLFDDDALLALFKRANAGRDPEEGELVAFQLSRATKLAREKIANAAIEARVQQQVAIQEAFLAEVLPTMERMGERMARAIEVIVPEKHYPDLNRRLREALATNLDQTHEAALNQYDRAMK